VSASALRHPDLPYRNLLRKAKPVLLSRHCVHTFMKQAVSASALRHPDLPYRNLLRKAKPVLLTRHCVHTFMSRYC
jgi:hypothetical protein